jgi:hypothetical protein
MVAGNFVGIVELEKSETKEEAMEKANKDCQKHLMTIQEALDKMKV